MYGQLKANIWSSALLRRVQSEGAFATLIHRGDPDAGAVIVKVSQFNGEARLYSPTRNMSGERIWLRGKLDAETEIDKAIKKRLNSDPDLWVIEIEDAQGRHFLTEDVVDI